MRDRKLATRYARALLATLDDEQSKIAEAFLTALADAFDRSPELRDVLLNPSVSRSARTAILVDLAEGHHAPDRVATFMRVVVDHGRARNLPEIAEAFSQAREQQAGIVSVKMETAVPLSADLKDKAQTILEKLTGKKVRMQFGVDPSQIGGAVARIGSKVYDGSLRTQLDILRQRMAAE